MYPQDATRLTQKLRVLFEKISGAEAELLQSVLERFDADAAEAVITRYSAETSTFDRGRLRTLLLDEQSRRSRRVSESIAWKKAKCTETEALEATFANLDAKELQQLGDAVQAKFGKLLKGAPMQSDLGRSLMYQEWLAKGAKVKELV